MGLRIIYGRSGTGKSEYIFDEIKNKIKQNSKIKKYIITPEQFSFTAEKKLMENMGSVIGAEVVTFNRMAYRVLQEVGGNINTGLTKCGKAMLIYSILQNEKNDLIFLNKSDENIDIAMRTITEFKKHGIIVSDLLQEKNNIEDKVLKNKLNDLIIIYNKFNEKIENKYIDETDLLTKLAENIDKTNMFKDCDFYIDEFSGFTEQEYLIIKKLIEIGNQVTITFCVDNLDLKTDPNVDVFYPNKITLSKILKIYNNNEKIELVNLNYFYRFKNNELKILEDNLYNKNINKYENKIENINLFLAKNQYSEIENIAKEINKLIKHDNYRYKDISIITKNIDGYSSLIRAIFSKYNIPVFIDEKRDLNQNIIIQYFLSILEILIKNYSYESIFNYIKIGFLEYDKNDIFKFEKYCIKYGIKNNKFKNDFIYGINEKNKEEIAYLNDMRKKIINPLVELKNKINENRIVENIAKEIFLFLKENDFEESLNKKIINLKNNNLLDLSKEYEESYKIILNILDEIVLIFHNEKMSIEKFYNLIKIGLKNSGLGKIPAMQDQVIVGDTDRSRSHKVKAIFIIGLNDGEFPNINKNEGFINDDDRKLLKSNGIELAKSTLENLYDDNFNIYKAFTTAEEKLFLSYASSDNEGKTLRPSILISKIKKIFPKLLERSYVLLYEENLNENNVRTIKNTICKENIQKLYGNVISTSVSRLEKYKSCPYSYFLQYILKIKEREEFKIQNIETGTFMHDIIDTFFNKIKDSGIELRSILDEEIESIVNNIIDGKLNENKNYIFKATAKYRFLVIRLKRIILKAIKYIVESLVKSDFNLLGTEIEFDEKGKYKPIILSLDDGKKIEITGKIDRIDIGKLDNKKYVRIIDYKSSVKGIDYGNIYGGLQLQLITYMDAVCNVDDFLPAGVLYFSLLEQMINSDKKISEEEIEDKIRNNFKMKGLVLADINIAKMHDRSLNLGGSKIVPVYIDKSGNLSNKKSSIATEEEFNKLQKYINKTIKEIGKEIFNGNVEIKPYYKNKKTPCEYCSYKTMCGFSAGICKNEYRYINNLSKEEILEKI